MRLHKNRKALVACNFNCLGKLKEFSRYSQSRIHCKSGNVSETVQDRSCYYNTSI